MAQLVITAVGPDHPGIVGQLTGYLHEAGANLADSRMVNLRGQFVVLLLVEGGADVLARVEEFLPVEGKRIGLVITCTPHGLSIKPLPGVPFRLKTYSIDQPGIVHRVSDLLQKHAVNIEELQTRLESGAFMGTPLFTMEMRLTIPSTLPVRNLRSELQALCDQLNCDMDLEPA